MFPVPHKPHDTRVTGGIASITASNETMMLSSGDQRLWLQGGRVFDESGNELSKDEFPGWFELEYAKLTPMMKATHPIDGSEPAGKVDLMLEDRINQLRSELATLETQQINRGAGVAARKAAPVDETDEEHLSSLTKEQIIQIAIDEDLDVDTHAKKGDLIQAVLAARSSKVE